MDSDDATRSSENDHCMCALFRKPLETLHFWANMPRIHNNSIADNLAFRNIQETGVYNQGVEIPDDATTKTTIAKTTTTRNDYSFYNL